MKVIHITGFSNTGKTTFIRALLPELEKLGPTGVVKHIGHHGYSLSEGKDTTLFFATGAAAAAGIDAQKSVVILQETDLERILSIFCDAGVLFAVVEGFKERPYPKVVIGNIPGATNVILTDPSVEEVLAHLDEFADLVTREGFSKEIERDADPLKVISISAMTLQEPMTKEQINGLLEEIHARIRDPGDVSVRFASTGSTSTRNTLLIGISARDQRTAIEVSTMIHNLILTMYTE